MDPAEMLTLTAITYRGCEFNLSNPHSRKIVFDEVARCLNTFSAVRGKWELAWGPAGHRPKIKGTDDSAMYVVRNIHEASTLAIVVRGTNFFSLPDALSNLPIDPKRWEYGGAAGDVTISHSTLLGLGILQRLRSGPVPAPPAEQTPAQQTEAANTANEARLAYGLMTRIFQGNEPFDSARYLALIAARMAARAVVNPFQIGNLLKDVEDTQPSSASAPTLLEFLKGFVANAPAGEVNIYVAGHSKGAALAPALALWLADTQGGAVASADRWDPASKAKLQLYSFAAPTAGNAGFAARFKQKIASAYRLANPFDIVPHVWDPTEIKQIPDLYGDQLKDLRAAADILALALKLFAYQHEVPPAQWNDGAVPQANFLQRAAVEHLDFYLKQLELYDGATMNTLALFAPIT